MERNISNLSSAARQGLFALALTIFSGEAFSQTTYTFSYTGSTQTIALSAGNYSVQCWGADGGKGFQTNQINNNGKGGYSTGTMSLSSAQTITVYVGGVGTNADGTTTGGVFAGGFNGGGSSGANNYATVTLYRAGGGGGGTDIRVGGNALSNRIIVAGGGGGGVYSASFAGGNGGGSSGGNGGNTYHGTGGTQTAGGIANGSTGNIAGTNGAFGVGGNGGSATSKSGGGGGGGGWYGGAGGATGNSSSSQGGGGGGSGYIGGVSSGTTIMFGQTGFVANPDVSGNGRVLIIELCNITLAASTSNSLNPAICSGQSLTLTTNAISNYSWSTGATTSSLVVAPTTNTVYSLTATSPSSCTASKSISVTVTTGVPVISVTTAPTSLCPGQTATLTAGGAVTYTWTNGVTNGVSFTPPSSADYTVTGENGCGTTTAVASVSIHPSPTLSPISVADPTICSGATTTLTASGSGISTYSWNTSSTSNSISVSPGTTTSYTVKATSAQGCTTAAVTEVTVIATPVQVPVASPTAMCLGNSSTLTAVGATYTWLPGGANTSSIVVTPATSGIHIYTVTKANSTCADTKTLAVTVYSLPVISAFSTPTAVCASIQTATLYGSGGISYSWTPSGINSASAIVTAAATTIYTLTASNGTCAGTNTLQLDVIPLPNIVAAASATSNCAGDPVTLSVTGGSSYTWSPGGAPFPIFNVNPVATTQYVVVGTNSTGCIASSSVTIVSYPNPTLNLGINNPAVCAGNPAVLTVSGADTYSWSTTSTANSVTVTPLQSTLYSVVGTNTLGNCSVSQSIAVTVVIPTVGITGTSAICEGGTATLTAHANGATSYAWNTGFPAPTTVVSPTISTIYVVTATVSEQNVACTATESFTVTVKPNPNIVATAAKSDMCLGEVMTFTATGGTAYTWSWGAQTSSAPTITITAMQLPNLVVNLTGTGANGCTNTSSLAIEVYACTGINEAGLSDNGVQVYPNPAHGEFNIVLSESAIGSAAELLLINETGQVVRRLSFNDGNGYNVSVSGLSNGVYYITGQSGTQTINKKIVVIQ